MQEIAQGTHNYQHFNEIMPTIYSRFMEKEAREWRQIYKVRVPRVASRRAVQRADAGGED
jgi:hypothetical protein